MNLYLQPVALLFQENANPTDAVFMKKYMRNMFEFFGIRSTIRQEIMRDFFKTYGLPELSIFESVIKELWQQPEREYQYFGIELTDRMFRKNIGCAIEVIEFMIVNKSWWDTVDLIAVNIAGKYFKKYPHLIQEKTENWLHSGNIWLQRTALLFQLKYKNKTNTALLFDLIKHLKDSNEFFIRKAIGWALREYSKTSPETVIQFVENNELPGLSRREALKWIEKKKV
ncbi:MAG: DNA alkylation repair protein [Bacteroidales bacterium]